MAGLSGALPLAHIVRLPCAFGAALLLTAPAVAVAAATAALLARKLLLSVFGKLVSPLVFTNVSPAALRRLACDIGGDAQSNAPCRTPPNPHRRPFYRHPRCR